MTGASSGIGKQTAITLSQIGAKLTLIARDEDKLQQTLRELKGEGHDYFPADLSDVGMIETLVKEVVAKEGPLDGLVYSAGVGTALPLTQSKPEKVQATFDCSSLCVATVLVHL